MQIKRLLMKLYVIALFFALSGCATQFKSYPPKSESLHAKIIIVDDNRFFTGSINMDPRSGNLNTEMGILFEQKEYVGKTIEQLPIYLAQNAYKLDLNNDKIQWIDLT